MHFPRGFYFGAATSAHQVEGGNRNDWTEWEKEDAKRLAEEAALRQAQGAPWADHILKNYPNPLQPENYISGKAADHYNRYEEDFDIAKKLGHNAHRFSVEWSRIEPEEGKFNQKEIEHYRKVIQALRERGLEPFVTLWHWTNPVWIRDIGGWENPGAVEYFTRYAEKITRSLESVRYWITINEPEVYSLNSYLLGVRPPQKISIFKYLRVVKNLTRAHQKAYEAIHSSSVKAGITQHNVYFDRFLHEIKDHQDFIGVNYYQYRGGRGRNRKSDMGWSIYSEGIYHVLKSLKKYNKPIYVTENGLADARDTHRGEFIREHVDWIKKAAEENVDVRGYFYWSLLDNFEWDKGFWPRFGLVEVDYKTMARKIRPSALVYRDIIKNQ